MALPDGHSGKEMVAYVKQAAKNYQLLNVIFHGVGGDSLSVSAEAHEQLVQYLAENQDIYWTDTYLNIMTHVNRYYLAGE